jgi:phage shock protein E
MEKSCETKASCREKMMKKMRESLPLIIGTIIGATIGLLYNRIVGCPSGTCAIVSNPWASLFVGGFLGYFVGQIIISSKEVKKQS